MNLKFRFK